MQVMEISPLGFSFNLLVFKLEKLTISGSSVTSLKGAIVVNSS